MIKKLIIFIFIFVFTNISFAEVWKAPDQEKAKKRAKQIVPFIKEYKKESIVLRKMRLKDSKLSVKDIDEKYFLLDSPIIKAKEDNFSAVRFAHKRHAALINDCTKCHHYRPIDAQASETTRCSACHQEAFSPENPERLGLKAALHQQCIECHKKNQKAPNTCTGCHLKNVPDHSKLVKLGDNPKPSEVTKECLRCHNNAGEEMLVTAHWLWKGPSPYTVEHRKDIQHGKGTTALNNY